MNLDVLYSPELLEGGAPHEGRRCRILGLGGHLPGLTLGNEELAQAFGVTDEWIHSRTGIRERRILEPGRQTSDMAIDAARIALANAGLQPGDITHVLLGSCAPDGLVPNTACRLAHGLGISGPMAMDFNVACSGFLYGLYLARAILLLEPEARILLVAAEAMSRICGWHSRNVKIIFGDGAGAAVLANGAAAGSGEAGGGLAVEDVLLGADGARSELLEADGGGSRAAYASAEDRVGEGYFLSMHGREVFKLAVQRMTEASRAILARNGLSPADVDLFVPHQANLRIIEAVGQRLGVPAERTHVFIERCGNTSGASVPLTLADAVDSGRVAPGARVLLVAFGAGFTWGAALLRG
jgi:3-oxoacyl-[acyl-carrier-protein] synthase III